MFFEDGPMQYVPNFSPGRSAVESLFNSPSGMPSVNTTRKPMDVDHLVDSLDNMFHQFNGMYALMNISRDHDPAEDFPYKSTAKSIKRRNAGNEKFRKGEFDGALKLYTKSVVVAEEGSKEQVLAIANRSAVLFRMNKFVPCLHDINRALGSSNYPDDLRQKLRDRKEQCLARLEGRVEENSTDPVNVVEVDDFPEWRSLCNFTNALIPNASPKIKIACDEKWGRHLVATADIQPGEILSSQKFNSLLLHENKKFTNCAYCLSECSALIPCPTCSKIMFCSKNCLTRALDSYHRVECKVMFKGNTSYKSRIIRMFMEGTEQGSQIQNLKNRMTIKEIFTEKVDPSNKPFVNDYESVLRLSRTFNEGLAFNFWTFLTDFVSELRSIQFVKEGSSSGRRRNPSAKLTEMELFVGMLLMNHAISARSHSFAISPTHDLECTCEDVVGIGICTLHSLINHSCDPNVGFITRNREHVLVATRLIQKGKQLFHNYWRTYEVAPKGKRNEILSMFFGFTCSCEACCKQWPQVDRLIGRSQRFFIGRKRAKKELLDILSPLSKKNIKELENRDILDVNRRVCNWFYANVEKPSYRSKECEHRILQLLALLYDNLSFSIETEKVKEHYSVHFFDCLKKWALSL